MGMAKTRTKGDPSVEGKTLSYKDYRKALFQLHVELVKLQEWVVQTGSKVCIVFEGRDGA
jgi:polyphosphate kinase 2 (PPK2 family)